MKTSKKHIYGKDSKRRDWSDACAIVKEMNFEWRNQVK
jgi:hypothetical protein